MKNNLKVKSIYKVIVVYLLQYSITICYFLFYYNNSYSNSIINIPTVKHIITTIAIFACIMTTIAQLNSMMISNAVIFNNKIDSNAENTQDNINNASNNTFNEDLTQLNNTTTYCKKCMKNRPVRAHHCSKCDECIRLMDHHCDWINNCVGESNQKSFFLFLFYSFIGTFIAACTLTNEFLFIIQHLSDDNEVHKIYFTKNYMKLYFYYFAFLVGTLLSLGTFVYIANLVVSQFNWLAYNMTGIEWKKFPKQYECPYCDRNIKKHFLEVFGDKWYKWFWPNAIKTDGNFKYTVKKMFRMMRGRRNNKYI